MGPQPLRGAVKSLVGPILKEVAAAAVALALLGALAPRGSSGLCSPYSVLTRECPVAEAGGWEEREDQGA